MRKATRTKLRFAAGYLGDVKRHSWENYLDKAYDIVEAAYDDEYDAMCNYPENFHGTESFERIEEACDCLSSALGSISHVRSVMRDGPADELGDAVDQAVSDIFDAINA